MGARTDIVEKRLLKGIPESERDRALDAIRKTSVWQAAAFGDAFDELKRVVGETLPKWLRR